MRFNRQFYTIKSEYCSIVSRFIQRCGELWHTETIEQEAHNALQTAVNKLIDRRLGSVKIPFIVRKALKEKCSEKLGQYFQISICKNVDLNEVESFYAGLDPSKLFEVQQMKKAPSLYPEENDMLILAEIIELLKIKPINLVSKDKHFTYFQPEIEDRYGLGVLDLRDLHKHVV